MFLKIVFIMFLFLNASHAVDNLGNERGGIGIFSSIRSALMCCLSIDGGIDSQPEKIVRREIGFKQLIDEDEVEEKAEKDTEDTLRLKRTEDFCCLLEEKNTLEEVCLTRINPEGVERFSNWLKKDDTTLTELTCDGEVDPKLYVAIMGYLLMNKPLKKLSLGHVVNLTTLDWKCFSCVLMKNTLLTELSLDDCYLGRNNEFQYISAALFQNKVLTSLSLRGNDIADKLGLLIKVLRKNKTLKILDLGENHFHGALNSKENDYHDSLMEDLLKFGDGLTNLSLDFCDIGGFDAGDYKYNIFASNYGAYYLFQGLMYNSTLIRLNLSGNSVGRSYKIPFFLSKIFTYNYILTGLMLDKCECDEDKEIASSYLKRNINIPKSNFITTVAGSDLIFKYKDQMFL